MVHIYKKLTPNESAYVSKKIPLLVSEGYNYKQAVAMAISMARSR